MTKSVDVCYVNWRSRKLHAFFIWSTVLCLGAVGFEATCGDEQAWMLLLYFKVCIVLYMCDVYWAWTQDHGLCVSVCCAAMHCLTASCDFHTLLLPVLLLLWLFCWHSLLSSCCQDSHFLIHFLHVLSCSDYYCKELPFSVLYHCHFYFHPPSHRQKMSFSLNFILSLSVLYLIALSSLHFYTLYQKYVDTRTVHTKMW